ncbi:MAG TPA: YicC family protein, partial [bacterium]|nr:YicC family protein [bacterium]
MLKSMTGFGQGKSSDKYGRFVVEVQTVNRKHLELNLNLPKDLIPLENDIRNLVSASLSRGKINVYVGFDRSGSQSRAVTIDFDLARKYYDAYAKLKSKFNLSGGVDLGSLINAKNVVQYEEIQLSPQAVMKDVKKALMEAISRVDQMRIAEGRVIYRDLKKRLKTITSDVRHVEKLMPKTVAEFERKLRERVSEFDGEKDNAERIAKEVGVFADRIDVSEEILRLESHVGQFLGTLDKKEPV